MSVIRVVLHNNLIHFGSPASTAFRSASRPTAVALTMGTLWKALLEEEDFVFRTTEDDLPKNYDEAIAGDEGDSREVESSYG